MSNNDDEYISSSEHESSRNTTDSPTVWIALKFVSAGNLASAYRLTFCRTIRNAVCCESQGVDGRWFFPFRQHGYKNNFRFPFTSLLTQVAMPACWLSDFRWYACGGGRTVGRSVGRTGGRAGVRLRDYQNSRMHRLPNFLARVAGVWKGRERGFWARGKREKEGKEGNACQETIAFAIPPTNYVCKNNATVND